MSYLGDFLFPPRRAQSPVRMLSGGERNRLLLARLFAQPANVLVLDEPTNDLDIESLELLEAALQDYAGTLLLVSHDRAFLDNVVTQTLAAEGGGVWQEYAGGYSDWLRQRPPPIGSQAAKTKGGPARKEQRETLLQGNPRAGIAAAGDRGARSRAEAPGRADARAGVLPPAGGSAARRPQRDAEIEALLHQKLERWDALEAKAKAAAS